MSNEQIARGPVLSIIAELDKRDNEIEQLRATIDAYNEGIEQRLLDAKIEIERLRGLLREVWDAAPYLGVDINRRVMKAIGDVPDAD
jgi:hypothetical protein